MPAWIRTLLQYVIIFLATGLLIWFSLRGLTVGEGENKWDYLMQTWDEAHKGWLLLMAALLLMSHVVRAARWRMLLTPVGFTPNFRDSFLSLMVGYLVNLVIPRGGEVSRCYNLFKLDKTPVEISFGTVVVERIVDILCLLILILLAFFLESQKLFAFIDTIPKSAPGDNSRVKTIAYIVGALIIVTMIIFWLIKKNQRLRNFFIRTWSGFKGGLLSVFKLENKWPFIIYSITIWLLYFVMSYCVVRAFPATSVLGIEAVLSLFAIGSIAMAVPTPGGAGSYHVLVPQGLVFLYGIPKTDAVAFTFIFHGWQTAILIVAGAVSLIVTSLLVKKNPKVD
ncbi:MAG: lysylphosphatidylglycerol synthase transmembrane domain-containing protein [Chryseolinea sp.]